MANQHKRPLFEKFEQAREYAELTLNGAEGRDPWLPYEETWHFIADAYLGLLEQLEATQRELEYAQAVLELVSNSDPALVRTAAESLAARRHRGSVRQGAEVEAVSEAQNVSSVLHDVPMKTIRVLVMHGGYDCDTGCCGHWVELDETGERIGGFNFSHPWHGKDDFREWALELAQEEVTARFGADHVADLDWENSVVIDD